MTKAQLYEKARVLPLSPGVYIIRDKTDIIIYIGKAKRLRTRVSQYFRQGVPHEEKVTKMIENAFSFDVIVTDTELEALVLECSLIKQHKPKYNILLKDDKGYAYVKVDKGDYGRITAELQCNDDNARYFGPFSSSYGIREMVDTANTVFRLPTCSRRFPQDFGKGRPCLNSHINRCMAVCTGKISRQQYAEAQEGALHMIRRGHGEIIELLRKKMEAAAEELQFERAAEYRNQIKAIEKATASQKVISPDGADRDIIAIAKSAQSCCAAVLRFRGGRLREKQEFVFDSTTDTDTLRDEFITEYYSQQEDIPKSIAVDASFESMTALGQMLSQQRKSAVKIYVPQKGDIAKLVQMAQMNGMERMARDSGRATKQQKVLDELAALLNLPKAPEIIESYDISNWGEGTSVAGMIVFENGKPKKAGYRRFKMKTVFENDDYASMAETLTRRVNEYEKCTEGQFSVKPSLILLDGGKGQVSAVAKAIKGTAFEDVPLFGMVKDNRHRTRAIINENGEIAINLNRGVFAFITSIQDEVHRFAIAYQRQGQKSKSYSSTLEKIKGVGTAKSKLLMAAFKTVKAVSEAQQEELLQVKGIDKAAAKAVFEYFHQ